MPARPLVEVEKLSGCCILRPEGDLDSHTAHEFRRRLLDQLDPGSFSLLVDLSGVPFIDSSGLRVLIECYRRARERSVRMRLFAPSPEVGEIFRLTRLDSILEVAPDRDTALREAARS